MSEFLDPTVAPRSTKEPTEYFTPADLATHFGVSIRTVRRWLSDGALPYFKVSGVLRISRTARDEFGQRHTRR